MQRTFTFLLLLSVLQISAQTIVDFEDFGLAQDTFLNGQDGSGDFSSNGVVLPNDYNFDFNSWNGWAISSTTDTITSGFMNQYSAIAGSGVENSTSYAVAFIAGEGKLYLESPQRMDGMYITNSTYVYLSMLEGDAFAKKFGGAIGDDPDFFFITIKKYLNGELSQDSIDFYLADYRFEDNSEDYIIDEWTYVDLTALGEVDSLSFTLTSSDVGQFGINTPTYFCVDNIQTSMITSTHFESAEALFKVYPNPATNFIQVENLNNALTNASLFSMNGQLLRTFSLEESTILNVQDLPKGTYLLQMHGGSVRVNQMFIKME